MYIRRHLEEKFMRMSGFFKAVLVTGARQVGKTTMLRHLAEGGRSYVSLDDTAELIEARENPQRFLSAHKPPVIIDEVQKAPGLFPYIKMICDGTDERGLFWLTGSEQFEMMKNVSESLAGRVGVMTLHPLSFSEINGGSPLGADFSHEAFLERQKESGPLDQGAVFDFIWRGGMPYIHTADEETVNAYFSSYVRTYLLSDARDDLGRIDETSLYKFLRACAHNAGGILNLNEIARTTGISYVTARGWLDDMVRRDIVYLLQPYENNRLKRLIKTPKLYFTDTGLCAALTQWRSADSLMNGQENGHYFENFVVSELIKNMSYSSDGGAVYYYRDSNGKEIDVVVECADALHPFEIKLSSNPTRRDIKNFDALDGLAVPRGYGGIICMCPDVVALDERDCAIPVSVI